MAGSPDIAERSDASCRGLHEYLPSPGIWAHIRVFVGQGFLTVNLTPRPLCLKAPSPVGPDDEGEADDYDEGDEYDEGDYDDEDSDDAGIFWESG